MRTTSALAAILTLPLSAIAAEPGMGTGGYGLLAATLQMLASLVAVVGLIMVFQYVTRRWLKSGPMGKGATGYIRIVETRYLTPKKSLLLVEVSGEYLLLGNSGDNLNLIKQVEMIEEIEVVGETGAAPPLGAFRERVKAAAARIPAVGGGWSGMLKKGGADL